MPNGKKITVSVASFVELQTMFKQHVTSEDKWQLEHTAKIDKLISDIEPLVRKHEQTLYGARSDRDRIGELERWKYRQPGLIGGIVSIIVSGLFHLATKIFK